MGATRSREVGHPRAARNAPRDPPGADCRAARRDHAQSPQSDSGNRWRRAEGDPMSAVPFSIDRRSGLEPEQFRREYYDRGLPVILTDASRGWRAHEIVTPDWLRRTYGGKKLEVNGREFELSALLDLLEAAKPGESTPYPCTLDIPELWPELLPLVAPLPLPHARPNRLTSPLFMGHRFGSRTEAFFGGPGGNFPYAHTDYYHLSAWITMIFGRKEFWVFATERNEYMYPEPPDNWRSQVTNIFDPDYEKFPLL